MAQCLFPSGIVKDKLSKGLLVHILLLKMQACHHTRLAVLASTVDAFEQEMGTMRPGFGVLSAMVVTSLTVWGCRSLEGTSNDITHGFHDMQRGFEEGVRGESKVTADPSATPPASAAQSATAVSAPPGAMIVIMPPGATPPPPPSTASAPPPAPPGTY
jgi:hypothetical protein